MSSGGDGTAKDITASVPASFAGKTIGFIIRHFDCSNQNQLLVDDFEVSHTTTLSTEDNQLAITGIYPNPVKDVITITNQLGQQVMTFDSFNKTNKRFDLSSLKKGFYFLSVNVANKTKSFKIIKE